MIVCGILRARPEWNQSRLSTLYCVSPASGETGMRKYFCTRKASAFVVVKQACLRAANTSGCMFKELEIPKGAFLCFSLFKGGGLMKTNHLELQGRRIEHRLDQSLPLVEGQCKHLQPRTELTFLFLTNALGPVCACVMTDMCVMTDIR